MDYEFKQKLYNNSVLINLVYDKKSYKDALSLKNKISAKYKNGIKKHSLKITLVPYSEVQNHDANIYYLFPSNPKNIKKVIKKAQSNQALTFSYLWKDLEHGVMVSVKVGNKIKPIINLNATKSNKITFRPVLLDISNVYSDNKESRDKLNIIKILNSNISVV